MTGFCFAPHIYNYNISFTLELEGLLLLYLVEQLFTSFFCDELLLIRLYRHLSKVHRLFSVTLDVIFVHFPLTYDHVAIVRFVCTLLPFLPLHNPVAFTKYVSFLVGFSVQALNCNLIQISLSVMCLLSVASNKIFKIHSYNIIFMRIIIHRKYTDSFGFML